MLKYYFGRLGRWLKRSWKDILSWVITIVCVLAVFVMGFAFCFILARDEILYWENMTTAPTPEVCALCRNGDGEKIHAPCIVNLSTGEVAELSVYEPHPTEVGEVLTELKTGYFTYHGAAGANIMRNHESEFCRATLPRELEKINPVYFCYECRRIISDLDKDGYIIADMYDPNSVSVYQIWNGAKYEIRDYLITVNKTENKCLEVEVHGLLEQGE